MCGADSYGDRAHMITEIAEQDKLGRRLVRGHPMIEAEVVYAARHEYCETAEDFIARRTRLAFLDVDATRQALPRVSSVSLLLRSVVLGEWRGSVLDVVGGSDFMTCITACTFSDALPSHYSFLGSFHHCRATAFSTPKICWRLELQDAMTCIISIWLLVFGLTSYSLEQLF